MSCQETTTRIITTLDEFRQVREPWNALCDERLFHRWEWLYSWWETWHGIGDLAILVVVDAEGRWIGMAPWFKTASASRGRVVRTLGSGAACSDYVSLVAKPGFEDVVADQIARQLFGPGQRDVFANVDLFEFEGHVAGDALMENILRRIPRDMADYVTEEIGGTWRTALPSSWEEFEAGLKKSFRRKTRKAGKRLAQDDFNCAVFRAPEQIGKAWRLFVDLHQRRRQSLGQPGCFADSRFESFLNTATLRLADCDRAQINMICHQGKPLTCNLEFASSTSVFMYQTGMDPDFLSLEPGHITFTWAIRQSISRRFQWFDFLRGDEPYKRFWNTKRIPLYRTRIVPKRLTSTLRYSILSAGRQVRSWARNVRDRFEKQVPAKQK